MQKLLFFLSFLFVFSNGYGQLEAIEEKGKYGALLDGEFVLKPKYDSITLQDEFIITAYRKKKIFYFNAFGEKIYAGQSLNSAPFERGSGIASKRNGKFILINRSGEKIMKPTDCDTNPTRYGKHILVVKNQEDYFGRPTLENTLYSDSGLVDNDFDTLYTFANFLITFKNGRRYKKSLGKLYDMRSGDQVETEINTITDTLDHLFLKRSDQSTTLYNKTDFTISRNHGEISFLDSIYFYSSLNDTSSLYKWKKHELLIKTKCDTFLFYNETIYAIEKPRENESPQLEIYDYKGNVIQKDLKFVCKLDEDRWIFGKGEQEYIGTQKGSPLSGYYTQISAIAVNGYRIVFESYRYTYINDSTYKKMPLDLAIIFRDKSYSNANPVTGLFQAFMTIILAPIAAIFAPLTGGKSFDMLRSFSPEIESGYRIKNPGERQYFSEGMAVFTWYGIDNDSTMVIANNDLPLYYNYIDTTGTILSEKKYKDCMPFHGGKAWVKEEDKDYILIDKNEKKVQKQTYESVRIDENGFHICSNEFTFGFWIFTSTGHDCYLYNDKNERLHKGRFSHIFFEDGAYYGQKGEEKILIHQLPVVEK